MLDQTAFYPEGGGQPWDLGRINDCNVIKVLEEDGIIYHYLNKSVIEKEVKCQLDWNRRIDHMQQHLGQHILSGAFEQVLDGETVGFHLGQDNVTIDIALKDITQENLYRVEDLANEVIQRNLEVKTYIVDKVNINQLPMRKPPKVDEDIRIVEVHGTDYSGCGGTHPKFTGEVITVKITGIEKTRGNVRVEFLCGKRALMDYRQKNKVILESSSLLSRPFTELRDGIVVIKEQVKELSRDNKLLKQELNQYKAEASYTNAPEYRGIKVVKEIFVNEDFSDIASLASSIANKESVVVLYANKGQKAQLIFTCSTDADLDMNSILKETLPMINGTGGGNKFRAQGGAPSGDNLEEAMELAFSKILQSK